MRFNKPIPKEKLKEYQSMNLEDKIKLSYEIIIDFYENVDSNKLYISSSFGKDSIVLIDLVRHIYPQIPIIYMNTGVDYKGCVELSKKYDNVVELKPKKSMFDVIQEYGYILPIGKEKTNTISAVRKNLGNGKYNTLRIKKLRGDFGEKSRYNYSKYIKHLLAPFPISEKCCHYLKIQPLNEYLKKSGLKYGYVGVTAEESRARTDKIISLGFNIKDSQSKPLGHWKEQDVLKYIVENDLPISDSYGEIIYKNGKYQTTLFDRNGCYCCPVASHLRNPNQYQMLKQYDYNAWEYSLNTLGFKQVLDWFGIPYEDIEDGFEEKTLDDYKECVNND